MTIVLILLVLVAVLAIFITNANQTIIEVILFGMTIKGSLGFILVGTLSIGIVLGIVSMLPSVWKRSFHLLRRNEELAQIKQKEAAHKPDTKQ